MVSKSYREGAEWGRLSGGFKGPWETNALASLSYLVLTHARAPHGLTMVANLPITSHITTLK